MITYENQALSTSSPESVCLRARQSSLASRRFFVTPLESVLTPNLLASPLESVLTKNSRGCGYALVLTLFFLTTSNTLSATPSLQDQPIRSVAAAQTQPPALSSRSDPLLAQAKSVADQVRAADAEPLARQAISKDPASADAHFLLGYILFRKVQQHAESNSGSPMSNVPERIYSEKALPGAEANFAEANARASLAEYTEGAKYHPPSAFDLKIVSLDYVLLGDYSDADKWLTKMLEWAPNDSEGWYYLGRTKYNENRFDEAIRAFQRCLQLDPKNVKAEDNLGLSYAGLGRAEDAIAAYETAIEWQKDASTKNPGPFIDMASLLLDQNRSTDAISFLRQALEIAPRDSKAHELLGKAYSRLAQFPH